ncbi:hypothetical protein [Kitasatospora sp. GP82]|uniref:hypothetical protein n=1 Tax=Kitasatospora sp. GP82 TaxID=3035089 RepID=UPI00247688BA|nr:hypothetical protein [Kitasatospora sp. GP82]MDH6124845.1 hypothetical protein [Kitasatospora sp. GP82]
MSSQLASLRWLAWAIWKERRKDWAAMPRMRRVRLRFDGFVVLGVAVEVFVVHLELGARVEL